MLSWVSPTSPSTHPKLHRRLARSRGPPEAAPAVLLSDRASQLQQGPLRPAVSEKV